MCLDEVDAILACSDDKHEEYGNFRSEFIQLWDGLVALNNVIVVGTTNHVEALDGAVLRRFSFCMEVR